MSYEQLTNEQLDARIAELESKVIVADLQQAALKVALNSAYGSLANENFLYFDKRRAEAVTSFGRLAIKWVERRLNTKMNELCGTEGVDYVVAVDTDSTYLNMEKLVEKFWPTASRDEIVDRLDDIGRKFFEPFIDSLYKDLFVYMNSDRPMMKMKRDVIASKGVWRAKKRYALLVHDAEEVRYESPELKIMGMTIVRSSTPQIARERMKETVRLMLDTDRETTRKYIEETKRLFQTEPIGRIVFASSANNLDKYYDPIVRFKPKAAPHVKGAINYRWLLKQYNLQLNYPEIKEGDRIYWCYVAQPNPDDIREFSFITSIPAELNLEAFVDRNTQYQRAYFKPMAELMDLLGWETDNVTTFEGLFQ